ncbi:class A beta-lactamase-related serine hydrolase [Brevundimonas naejangsanensis]|uniref:Class A beta-lactamase-related serine hydrolase n=1 Tax=Brevundimonas naejangsanensis TaxID=588932 RepID=A0A494RI51_9CAUL|nr:serine hydrolase domain-containing protein [Brevundimonas naejangsanensis]AYG94160.1 class A beta-lactamase-related serine hydrolase [Brevundimonas naejangsanensis]
MITRRHALAAGAAAVALPSIASAGSAEALDAALSAAFDAVGPVALAGGLVTPQGLAWSGARGVRRADHEALATADDRWHLGSNTKAMTAALWGRLVEQGRARWAMPLADVFPGLRIDPAWGAATIDDFMSHAAGLADASVMGRPWLMTARADPRSLPEQRRALVEQALKAPPAGTPGLFQYGNANYVLVGAAIEAITGGSWEDAMRAEVFAPLDLASGGFGAPGAKGAGGDYAWGHRRTGGEAVPMNPADPGADNPLALGPAGTAHMSLADYARFLAVFLTDGGGWLSAETVRRLTTPSAGRSYALGWIALPPQAWAGGPVVAHEGSNTLWRALALVDVRGGRAFIGLSNDGERGGPACQALARGLIAAASGAGN